MPELKDRIRVNDEGGVVLSGDYVKHQLGAGMKGFFTPYISIYEALTGTQHQLVKRDAKSGRFASAHRLIVGGETRKRA